MKFILWLWSYRCSLTPLGASPPQSKLPVLGCRAKPPRMIERMLISIVLCAVISQLAPQKLPVSIYKISLVVIAGVVSYWLDRSLFPHAPQIRSRATTSAATMPTARCLSTCSLNRPTICCSRCP
ncbi:putative holin [Duganella sp. HH105]|uniref:putative holin n=1 Tax=Duganella sp. HH105 TaxID=1781067 RepID=UPI001E292EA7|nr:putative holin [Duganella sp. HH105]